MFFKFNLLIFLFSFFICFSLKAEIYPDVLSQDIIDRCKEQLLETFIKGLNDNDRKILAHLSGITTLKLASLTSSYNKKTLEQTLARYQEDLKQFDSKQLGAITKDLQETYKQEIGDHDKLIQNIMNKNNFAKPNTRLTNTDLFHFVALYRHQNPVAEFNASDEAMIWLTSKASNSLSEQYGSYSLNHNLSEYSNNVSKLLSGNPSFVALRERLSQMENELIDNLKAIEKEFRENAPECYDTSDNFLGTCQNNRLFLHNVLHEAILKNFKNTREIHAQIIDGTLRMSQNQNSWEFIPLNQILAHRRDRYGPGMQVQDNEQFLISAPLRFESLKSQSYQNRNFRSFNERRNYQRSLQDLPQADRIKRYMESFFKENPTPDDRYAIVHKEERIISIFNVNGELKQTLSIAIPNNSDADRHSGSGEWTFIGGLGQIILTNKSEHRLVFPLLDLAIPLELTVGDRVIILPSNPLTDIYIRDGKLSLETTRRFNNNQDRLDYNLGPRNLEPRETMFLPTHKDIRTAVSIEFAKALGDEKANLMKLYDLSNEEYNELARLAFGILGNESKFGTSYKYLMKEASPTIVSLLKGEGFDTSSNSRGPTQIKRVPDRIATTYGVTKDNLRVPKNAAVATLGFLAQSLTELKNIERRHEKITPLNRYDFLHYIYTGRRNEITQGTGTPEQNIYFRNLSTHADKLTILEAL